MKSKLVGYLLSAVFVAVVIAVIVRVPRVNALVFGAPKA